MRAGNSHLISFNIEMNRLTLSAVCSGKFVRAVFGFVCLFEKKSVLEKFVVLDDA